MQERNKLLKQISQCEFVLIDINLYLDTHPDDVSAIEDYNAYARQLEILKNKFTRTYGPIHNFGNSAVNDNAPFSWVSEPFPWNCDF